MKPKHNTHFLEILVRGIFFFISLLLLSIIFYLSSSKALGKTGVVVASVVFLLNGAILITGMVVVIKSAFRSRMGKIDSSDRVNLILWGILLPVLFAMNFIGLPYLQDCLEGNEITQQFLIREISMNGGRSGTVIIASAADAEQSDNFDALSLYDDVYDPDPSIINFHSGILGNFTFMKDFFDTAGINVKTRDWVMTSTETQLLYATITYYPRTHAILAYKDVKIVPVELAE